MTALVSMIARPTRLTTTKIINGAWTASVQCIPDSSIVCEGYADIDSEEYIIKTLKKTKADGSYYDISLFHNMVELSDLTIDRFSYTKTVSDLLTLMLAGSGWTAGVCDVNETLLFEADKRLSILEALTNLAEQCAGELYFHSKTRVVDLKHEIGTNTQLQLRVDKNCTSIEKTMDTSDLITRIYPLGPDNYTINTTYLEDGEDETLYTMSGSATAAASTQKMSGSQGIQLTFTAVNETGIRDLGVGGVVDLTGHTSLKFWIYSTVANASGYTFGIGESAYTENVVNTGALVAGCWKEVTLDLSGVADASKNAIRYIGFKNLTAGASVMVFDYIRAFNGLTYIDSANLAVYQINKEYVYNHSSKVEKTSFEKTIYPSADAFVYAGHTGTNYGTRTTLKARDYGATTYESFIKFALTEIPAGATITAATLNFTVYDVSGGGNSQVEARLALADWAETTITYTNKPGGTAVQATFDMTSKGLKSEDITTAVQGWFATPATNYGLRVKAEADPDVNKLSTFYSRESATDRPYIVVTYTVSSNPGPVIEAAARAYMDDRDEPKLSYKVKMCDLSKVSVDTWDDETIDIGDTVRIYDVDLGINVSVRVKKITKDLLNPENITIELENKAACITDIEAKRAKQLSYAMPFMDNVKIITANSIQEGYTGSNVNV